jgi:simple sugar transport system ATP-binding protein
VAEGGRSDPAHPAGSQPAGAAGTPPALELRKVTKRFGALVANDAVDFDLRAGEVHALLGENGAGKSTLMNVLYGLHRPDEGEMRLRGERVEIASPREAIRLGIGMVHQHFMLIPVMTVAENIVLGAEPRKGAFLDGASAEEKVRELSERFGLEVDPHALVENISVGQQQRVEILRALYHGTEILVLDEPTAVLTAQEVADLFRTLRSLRDRGTAIAIITHKLGEVLEIADRISVLRRGKLVATVPAAGATEESLAQLMVGRDVLFRVEKAPAAAARTALLEIAELEVDDDRGLEAVRGLSLTVHAGEIVGLAGVDGNGQSELVEAITGLRRARAGTVRLKGRDITNVGAREAAAAGLGHIAEDRHRRGLVLPLSLAENVCLRSYRLPPIARAGLLSPRRMRERSEPLLQQFDVRGGDCDTPAAALSGGNQQKCVIAREIAAEPDVLVAAQPTRGLDVGAIEFVHRRLVEQRAAGRAVLLVSLELEEIRSLADRVLVVYEGRIVAELPPETSEEDIGLVMLGGRRAAA